MSCTWHKEAIIYQIYPRSFFDSNGDGIGDLKGITQKLDYLAELGVNAVWISPYFQSPNDDNGYDISNYRDIMPDFGTMDDWKEMISQMHKRGIKLIMDLVVNHTSDEHPWFLESKKSKDNPYRDYYIWREGKGKKPPNNWTSFFTGKAWQYDPNTQEYYLHMFSKKQPDLNWDNPKVREEVKDIIKFWADLGVDGFRCDVINVISKTPDLPNGKFNPFLRGLEKVVNGPNVHKYLQEINRDAWGKYDCLTVGEMVFLNPETANEYTKNNELDMFFHFEHTGVDSFLGMKWFITKFKPKKLKRVFSKWQYQLKGWNSLFIENHDQPRSISRFGDEGQYWAESAKMLATMLYMQKGTPFIYQGQEMGMTNAHFENLEDYKDIESHNIYKLGRKIFSHKRMMGKLKYMSRDNARTPMQWSDEKNAGFSTGTPWIKVNENYKKINVQNQINDPNSILSYYKQLIRLRKQNPVILYGEYKEYYERHSTLYVYTREYNGEKILVINNFSKKNIKFKLIDDLKFDKYELLISNYDVNEKIDNITLRPYETRVYKVI